MRFKSKKLSSTVIPIAVVTGFVGTIAVAIGSISTAVPAQTNPCAAKRACNPCAAQNPCRPGRANPCAAKNPCNPCAAKNPCNPCAGAAASFSSRCVVPRLVTAAAANPCAAKKPCGPCSAKAANPCAAKNPCNPAAAKNPCNPCAAKNPCNPCNPCSAAAVVEMTDAEAIAAYDCILTEMKAAYAKSGLSIAKTYVGERKYNRVAYQSATHGNRFVNNYANSVGGAYGKFEKSGQMPAGAYLVKDSFTVMPDGKIGVGPLFVMRKMSAGFNRASGDWKYAMVMPDGSFFGETNGRNAEGMKFCYECHMLVPPEQDSMYFLPEDFRKK